MSISSRRISAWSVVLLFAATLSGATAGALPAQAAGHEATGAAGSAPVTFTRQCPAPTPGHFTCFSLRRTDTPVVPQGVLGAAAAVDLPGYSPADLTSAYGLPSRTAGAGTVVAIIDAFDNPNAESDLAVYRSQFELPACTTANGCFRKADQRGGTAYPVANSGWAGEIALDVDMVSAACPLCHILLVETDDNSIDSLGTGVNRAVTMGANFVSNSYGGGEDGSVLDTDTRYYDHPGVAITASTGDAGYGVSYPATSRFVTAVGGTTLSQSTAARGWDETAWAGAGSGCSAYEPKPAFQKDKLCTTRTVADVSAIADPNPGVTVYNSYFDSGWRAYGGTSASAPIIAATYALAGRPNSGDHPNAYPYSTPSALNDVVNGSNGSCNPTPLCTAVSGYDGPTGLGTPAGTAAFKVPGPHGLIAGTVTDASTGAPAAGILVAAGTQSVTTDQAGHFLFSLPPATYRLTLSGYGYLTKTVTGVVVTNGGTTTRKISLQQSPHVTISGRVTDGSGHGWPVYARVSVRGTPLPAAYSDPFTGAYRISVPAQATYVLDVAPQYAGYPPVSRSLTVADSNVSQSFRLPVDIAACNAAGYSASSRGMLESFDSGTKPAGWSVVDKLPSNTWTFNDPAGLGNQTGGNGAFASVNFGSVVGGQGPEDTTLISAPVDLSAVDRPTLSWDNAFVASAGPTAATAAVEYTIDGGATWHQVWSTSDITVVGPVTIALPLTVAHKPALRLRFHFTSPVIPNAWQVDNVFVGQHYCTPTSTGLVAGVVTDRNTGRPMANAVVRRADATTEQATTIATPEDPRLPDGFYWLVSTAAGTHRFVASKPGYLSLSHPVDVLDNTVRRQDFALAAGRLSVTAARQVVSQPLGSTRTTQVTLANTGTSAATVAIGEQAGGVTVLAQHAAARRVRIPGVYSPNRLALRPAVSRQPAPVGSAASSWATIADYPTAVLDNAVGYQAGRVYSVGGTDGAHILGSANVFDPAAGSWSPIAPLSTPREKPAGAFLGGKFYVAGGWGTDGTPVAASEVYDPARATWTSAAAQPTPLAASGVAVLAGKMYVVGGCDIAGCGSSVVQVYDPATNRWSKAADFPELTAWLGCGGINGRVYCAGGLDVNGGSAKTFVYDPAHNSWSAGADLPVSMWGMAYTAANNRLLVSTGVVDGSSITNEGFQYDPAADRWSPLPNATTPVYRAGGGCGFYKVGGGQGVDAQPVRTAEVLPGFDSCGDAADVPWLTRHPTNVTIPAGAKVTVSVTTDARAVSQPGTYTAALSFTTSAPYPVSPVTFTMHVTPPASWGKIVGTVTGVHCGTGTPLPGAIVEIDSAQASWTLVTDRVGGYGLWLGVADNPLQLIASQDGWQPQARVSKVIAGATVTDNFALKSVHGC